MNETSRERLPVDSAANVALPNQCAITVRQNKDRKQITLDLTPAQITWLDQQAAPLMSRSAFVRQLIATAMEKTTK